MKWFRYTLKQSRIFIGCLILLEAFTLVEGNNFVQAYQEHELKEERLEEISELLDIPVEKLRPDHKDVFDAVRGLLGKNDDPVKVAGWKRLQETLRQHEEKVANNPYRSQIEAVKQEHALLRIEGMLQDLMQLTTPGSEKGLSEASQRALMRNLHHGLRERVELPPLADGLPAKAQAKQSEMQDKLDRWVDSVRPIVAATQEKSMSGTLAQKVEQLRLFQGADIEPPIRDPRFTDRQLPLRQVERKAKILEATKVEPVSASAGNAVGIKGLSAPSAPNKAVASEITQLATSLGNSPARIFTWVHDNIDFDAKFGAVKGPVGTLLERSGTPWDQAWLLHDLLVAAGVPAQFEWGEVEITPQTLTNITGLDDPFRAGDLLTTAGVPVVLFTEGSRVAVARMPHVWIKAFVDYIPNRGVTSGPGDTWVRMDPSIKRFEYQPGVAAHQNVPFTLGGYLTSGTPQSPRRFYEDSLATYNHDAMLWVALEEIKQEGRIVADGFPFIPGTLQAKVIEVLGEADAVPANFQHRLRIEARTAAGTSLLSWESATPPLYGQRLEVAYVGATADDQIVIDQNGGIFDTPPYLIDLQPEVRLAGSVVAGSGVVGSAEDMEIWVTLLPVDGFNTTLVHETFAGEFHVMALDLGGLPQTVLDQHQQTLNSAAAAGDETEVEAETLYLLGGTYMHDLSRDLSDLAAWKWHRLVKLGTEGLVSQSGKVTVAVDGTPLAFSRAGRTIDIARMILGLFSTEGDTTFTRDTFELLGAQSSFLEGEIFEQVVREEGIASVSALTRSLREGQVLTRIDSSNVSTVLAQVTLEDEIEAAVQLAVSQGKIAWVAESEITVNQWRGTGYVLEDPTTGAAAYLISGGLAGGSGTGSIADVEDLFGSEPWLEASPLGSILRFVLSLFGSTPPDAGGGPGTNQGDPVNLATGNMWFAETDLSIQALRLPIVWSRTYNSRSAYEGPFGFGWTSSYGAHLVAQVDGSQLFREPDGTEHTFAADGAGGFEAPPGVHSELSTSVDGFTLRTREGILSHFDTSGRLLRIEDPNTNVIQLTYGALGELESVIDAAGRTVLNVTTDNGRITEVADFTGRTVQYGYSNGDLVSVTDSSGEAWIYAYDTAHNLIAKSDPLGNTETWAYDGFDRCLRHVDPLGQQETFHFTSSGRRGVYTNRRGFETFVEFDERGRAVTGIDAVGNLARMEWDADNNPVKEISPLGGEIVRTFDDRGNVTQSTDVLGETTTLVYEPVFNRLVSTTDMIGHTIGYQYDAAGKLLERSETIDGDTVTRSFAYDAVGNLTTRTDANGNSESFAWDSTDGSLRRHTDAVGNETNITVDTLGRATTITDAVGNDFEIGWDEKDRMVRMTDQFGKTVEIDFDAADRAASVTTPRGTNQFTYDAGSRVIALTDVLGDVTRTEFDAEANVVAEIDARGNRTSFVYDALDRRVTSIDPQGNAWVFDYLHNLGRSCASCSSAPGDDTGVSRLIDPLGQVTEMHYDVGGRLLEVTDPLGGLMQFAYDGAGRRTSVTDPLGHERRFEWDELNRLQAVVEPDGGRTEYTYDHHGNLLTMLDALGSEWTRTYDELNRMRRETDPLGQVTIFRYDALGNVAEREDPSGEIVRFEYDARRLTEVRYPGGAVDQFTYDFLGRQVGMSNANGSFSMVYDASDRLVSKTDNQLGETLQFEYDADGNQTAMVGPRGRVDFIFDSLNRLVQQNDPVAGTYRFRYDALGRRTHLEYPNGIETAYTFDANHRILSLVSRSTEEDVVDGYSYTYDAVGNRLSTIGLRDSVSEAFGYDAADRLVSRERAGALVEEWDYDLTGNRTRHVAAGGETVYSYDLAHRLLSEDLALSGGGSILTQYTWSPDGTMIGKDAGGIATTFDYDALDRLVRVSGPAGEHRYGYDPLGARVVQERNGVANRLLVAAEDVVGAFDSAGTLTSYFAHGPGIDEPLAEQRAGQVAYLHHDGLGSITASSGINRELVSTTRYAPFGAVEEQTGTPSRFGFTARETDETGLQYNRARFYDSGVGRFLSTDPFPGVLDEPFSQHPYMYGRNNPLRYTDPTGETWAQLGMIVAGGTMMFVIGSALLLTAVSCIFHDKKPWNDKQRLTCIRRIITLGFNVGKNIPLINRIASLVLGYILIILEFASGTIGVAAMFLLFFYHTVFVAFTFMLNKLFIRWLWGRSLPFAPGPGALGKFFIGGMVLGATVFADFASKFVKEFLRGIPDPPPSTGPPGFGGP